MIDAGFAEKNAERPTLGKVLQCIVVELEKSTIFYLKNAGLLKIALLVTHFTLHINF